MDIFFFILTMNYEAFYGVKKESAGKAILLYRPPNIFCGKTQEE
jgi:hypothetical protein